MLVLSVCIVRTDFAILKIRSQKEFSESGVSVLSNGFQMKAVQEHKMWFSPPSLNNVLCKLKKKDSEKINCLYRTIVIR